MSADNQQERLLNPWYITGWFDGEGCFSVSVHPHPSARYRWLIDPVVQTYQHKDSIEILERIKNYFKAGVIRPKGPSSNVLTYSVESRSVIYQKIIPHFIQYPLQTRKNNDFILFCKIIEAMENKEHHQIEGFKRIVDLAFQMNPHGKNRKYELGDIIKSLKESSETIRQTCY
jgi:LAGLIDADG endonuclease